MGNDGHAFIQCCRFRSVLIHIDFKQLDLDSGKKDFLTKIEKIQKFKVFSWKPSRLGKIKLFLFLF
jgi:hypothetical protein